MAKLLGTKKVENLGPGFYKDGGNGLWLKVTPAGKRVWRWSYWEKDAGSGRKQRTVTLGYFTREGDSEHLSVSAARSKLEALKGARIEHRLPEVLGTAPDRPRTVKDLAEKFYERRILPHRRRPEYARGILDRDVLPTIGTLPLKRFDVHACTKVVEAVVDRGATTYAGAVLGLLKQMGRWGKGRGYLDDNPADALEAAGLGVVSNRKDRWLTSEEIPLWWAALDGTEMTPTVRAGLRILLYTGLRTGELLKSKWVDVDLKGATLTIPVENQKLKKKEEAKAHPFIVPLPPPAVEILKTLKKLAGKSPWVMYSPATTKGEKEEERITDKTLARANRRMWEERRGPGNRRDKGEVFPPLLSIPPATPHDLRRTMRSHLGRLRVPLHVAERCLNHTLGRIVETYDQGDYLDERREALEKWAELVGRLVRGEEAAVVSLPVAR